MFYQLFCQNPSFYLSESSIFKVHYLSRVLHVFWGPLLDFMLELDGSRFQSILVLKDVHSVLVFTYNRAKMVLSLRRELNLGSKSGIRTLYTAHRPPA